MGAGPHSGALPGPSPRWGDHVTRMYEFIQRHPEVSVTVPRQNGTRDFIAVWVDPPGDPKGARTEIRERDLGRLMNRLEDRFDGG